MASPPQPSPPQARRSFLRSAAFALLASLRGYATAACISIYNASQSFALRYSDPHLPMLGKTDGDSLLWRSRALLDGSASWPGEPALNVLGTATNALLGVPLELVAYWLPALLTVGAGLWTWCWARLLNAPLLYRASASFLSGFIPAWFTRACTGRYDTDPGNVLLVNSGLYATACLGLPPGRPSLRPVSRAWPAWAS